MIISKKIRQQEKELKELLGIQPDECPDLYDDLKMAAWNILHENPGIDFGDWQTTLIEQYPTEVVDAIGSHPAEVYATLSDMWDCDDYEDTDTGECHSYAEWAEIFATDRSVQLYDSLAEARREISLLKARQGQRQGNPQPNT